MLKHLHLAPLALFSTYFVKLCFFSASYPEAIILTSLGLVTCYFQSKDSNKKLKEFDNRLNTAVDNFKVKEDEIKKLRETVNSMKLGIITRPNTNVR